MKAKIILEKKKSNGREIEPNGNIKIDLKKLCENLTKWLKELAWKKTKGS